MQPIMGLRWWNKDCENILKTHNNTKLDCRQQFTHTHTFKEGIIFIVLSTVLLYDTSDKYKNNNTGGQS